MSEHPERWLSELYRASAREEPPRSLDVPILEESRKGSRRWLSRFLLTWEAPLAAAAVIVVAVTVVIAVRDEQPYVAQPAVRPDIAESAAAAKAAAPIARESQEDSAPSSSIRKQQAEGEPKRTLNHVAQSVPEQASRSLADERSSRARTEERMKQLGALRAPASAPVEADAPAPAGSPATVARAAEARSVTPPAATEPVPERAADTQPEIRERASAQAIPAAPASKSSGRLSAESGPEKRPPSAADPARPSLQARQEVANSEAARRFDSQVADQTAPEVWVEGILKLRKEGRDAEAKESLAAFKKRYPEYVLPPALRDF